MFVFSGLGTVTISIDLLIRLVKVLFSGKIAIFGEMFSKSSVLFSN